MPRPTVDPRFGVTMRRLREQRGTSLRSLASATYSSKSHLHDFEAGVAIPRPETAQRIDEALGAGGLLVAIARTNTDGMLTAASDKPGTDEELEALELARRVEASDVSGPTLDRLERVVDDLAIAYASTQPAELLPRVRRHLAYVGRLLDSRKTLQQHRRLLTAGGWLCLLAATLNTDVGRRAAAAARLATAVQMAGQAEQAELLAWCAETRAWALLTDGDFARAVDLSQQAQALAPRGSSAHIQATAQEGRAHARMHRAAETRHALGRLERLAAPLAPPENAEHHYQYDPAKAVWYTATVLAWVGDPAAERYARDVVRRLEALDAAITRPRRLAIARLDLGLALLAADKPDEAAAEAMRAITSGKVVQSTWWRAAEVVHGVEHAGVPEATGLLDAMWVYARPVPAPDTNGHPPPSE